MGQDGNSIEIEIDAAATQAAAKTAGEANAKLEEFNNALKLFRDNVGTISKTTDSVAGKIGDFNTLLQTFSDKLTENLANMQTSVVAKVEPHLERELENLVNRVTNKVEAKYKPEKESRSRSEAKAGAGATPQVVPSGKRISVASPPGDRPDALLKEQLVKSNERIVDKMGNVVGGALKTTSKTQTSRFEFGQEKNAAGELVDIRREIVDEVKTITKTNFVDPYGKDTTLRGQDRKTAELFSMLGPEGLAKVENAPEVRLKDTFYGSISDALDKSLEKGFSGIEQYVPEMMRAAEKNIFSPYEKQLKQNEKTARVATVAEKDRGLAIRREITGALIGLHVMKVVSQYSAVFNAGFMQIAAAIGHLLNNLLLPMMPMFTQVAQFLHMLANVLAMLPMPVRQLIGALLIWKATSMMVAGLPIKDFADGIRMVRDNLRGSGDLLAKFGRGVVALIKFMNTNLMNDKVDALAGWAGRGLRRLTGKRAGGGPVLGHGAYIVGEKGPEIFVPKVSGAIIPNHKIGRAGGSESGNDVVAAPFGGDILGNLVTGLGVGGLAYMLTGSPLLAAGLGAGAGMLGPTGIANMIGSAVSSDIGANMIASLNVMTGMISSILAPLAPIMGVVGALLGVVTGARAAGGGGGDRTAETVAKFGNEQLKTTGKMSYGIQNATAMSGRGINKILSMILIRLGNCLYVAPCKPDSFAPGTTTNTTTLINTITALPAAISVAITAALAALAGTITYTILTNGQVPVVTPITTTITYIRQVVGSIPVAESIERFITWTRRVVGLEPVTTDKVATITYNIVKNGTEPIATSVTAYIEYVIKTTGSPPTLENLVAWIEAKFGPIAPEEWARLKELVLAKSATDPPKIVVTADGKVEVEGEVTKIEDRVPTEEKVIKDVKAKVAQVIDGIADPADKTIKDVVAEAEKIVDKIPEEAKRIKVLAEAGGVSVPEGTKLTGLDAEVNPKVDVAFLDGELQRVFKIIQETRRLLLNAEFGSETYFELKKQLDGYLFDAKDIKARIAELKGPTPEMLSKMVIELQGTITSLGKQTVIGDMVVDVVGDVWEVRKKAGSTLTLENIDTGVIREVTLADEAARNLFRDRVVGIDVRPTDASITTMNDIIAKRLTSGGGVSVPLTADTKNLDPRKIVEGLNWKSAGQFAGDMLMFGVLLGAQEFAKTGKIDFVKLVGGLTLGTAGFAIGEKIIGGVANYIGGAGAKALVTKAFTGFGIFLAGQVGGDVAKYFIDSIKNGVANFSGDLGQIQFNDNVILESARRLGQSFGVALDEWMATNLHVTIPDTAWQSIGAILTKAGELTVTPGLPLTNLFAEFISKLQTTLSGGVPVDVRIDVDSVTSVVEQISGVVAGATGGGSGIPTSSDWENVPPPYEAPGPDMSTGNPYEAPGPDMSTGNPLETGGGGMDIGNPLEPRARGGPVRGGGSYLVGERGPEMFVPDRAPAGGGGGNTINFSPTFNVTTNNPKELTDTVMKQLKLELARVKM